MEISTNTRNRFDDDIESGGGSENIDRRMMKENDSLLGELSRSLKTIKNRSNIMKEKLTTSNQSAEDISDIFAKSFKVISDTMNKLTVVLTTNSGLYCYLACFVILVMFVIFLKTMLT